MVVEEGSDDVKIDQIDEQPTQAQVAVLMTEGTIRTPIIIIWPTVVKNARPFDCTVVPGSGKDRPINRLTTSVYRWLLLQLTVPCNLTFGGDVVLSLCLFCFT